MIKKISLLTKVFLKDYYQSLKIIRNNKLNKKSILTWMLIIFAFSLAYLSEEIISIFQKAGAPILFLKIYLPIIATIMIIQLITLICRICYYSKDLENVMSLPAKTREILIAKLNTVIVIMYFVEALFLVIPMLMYGILEARSIIFFVSMIITLLFFPILFVTIISIMMLFIMQLAKIFRNQDVFQLIVVTIISYIIIFTEIGYVEKVITKPIQDNLNQTQQTELKIDEINKGFFIIEPLIKILDNKENGDIIINFMKVIIITSLPLIFYILIGEKLYLKNILPNKVTTPKILNKKNKYKQKNKKMEYIKKEIKKVLINPSSFMQNIVQYLILVLICAIILFLIIPIYVEEISKININGNVEMDNFKLQITLTIVGMLQLIFTFSNLSITSISREGKNAKFMKYIPIPLYNQLKMKTLPQIFLNTIVIITILYTISLKIPKIGIEYYIIVFIIASILNILNSYIMILIDLKNPNLNWTNEESISKNNKNKLYQYVITIFICLILSYFSKVFENINFIVSIIAIIILLCVMLIALKKYIKNNINKLFIKIY